MQLVAMFFAGAASGAFALTMWASWYFTRGKHAGELIRGFVEAAQRREEPALRCQSCGSCSVALTQAYDD